MPGFLPLASWAAISALVDCVNMSTVPIGKAYEGTYLQRLDLTLLRHHLPPPGRLTLCRNLHARFELVDLLPAVVQLLPHFNKLVRKAVLRLLRAPLEVDVDLAELFQTGDEIVVEDAEVGEGLRLSLTALLLQGLLVRVDFMKKTKMITGVLSTPSILSIYW